MVAAVPVVAPVVEKCLRAEQIKQGDAGRLNAAIVDDNTERLALPVWRVNGATMSCVSMNLLNDPVLFKAGDIVILGDDPRQ